MATLMHTIKSSILVGAGMVGCGPYGGEDQLKNPYPPEEEIYDIEAFNALHMNGLVTNITNLAKGYEANNQIDKFSNMNGDKIYVNHGSDEETVAPGLAAAIGFMYGNLSSSENFNIDVNMKVSIPFGHSWPFNNGLTPDFPYEMIKHFYSDLSSSGVSIPASFSNQIKSFSQAQYCENNNCEDSCHMSNTGYYYAPPACNFQTCRVLFHLHGCGGSAVEQEDDPTVHIRSSGLLQIADVHNIIVVFPQSMPGCWNHDGNFNMEPSCAEISDNFSCLAYLTYENKQVSVITKMINDMVRTGNSDCNGGSFRGITIQYHIPRKLILL